MPIIKFPASMSEKEALQIVQGQGLVIIISVTRTKDGSILINAEPGFSGFGQFKP